MELSGRILNHKYKVLEKVAEKGPCVIYRALDRLHDDEVLNVKFLRRDRITNRIEDVIRFRADVSAVALIDHPGIVRVFEAGESDELHYIATEALEAPSLDEHLNGGTRLSPDQSVTAVIRIAEALSAAHEQGILHRDLTPANIILPGMADYAGARLQDFGIAHLKDYNGITDPDEITATFSYMSPEQSGMIKYKVGAPSDLYSLGIIFYRLITGSLPFRGRDVSTIIHQHIAMLPEPPSEIDPQVPEILSRIILKLLEKEPGKRYQSAQRLLGDLGRFRSGEMDFEVLHRNQVARLSLSTPIIGREEEYGRLMHAFERALNRKGGLFLVAGESGIGKTRLIHEMVNNVYYHRGTFIEGTCFAGENKVPYGAISDALGVYVRYFNEYPEERKDTIRGSLRNTAGNLGEIIMNLNPRLKDIIGEYPPLVEIRPDRELKRFLMTATRFIYALSAVEDGLVIILDHLQWMDEGSFSLLLEIMKEIHDHPLLIIGMYRSEEIRPDHSLQRFLSEIRDAGYPVDEVHLPRFDGKDMRNFMSHLLGTPVESTAEIAAFIHQKSTGNPFFAMEITRQLVEEKALFSSEGRWTLDRSVLEGIEISATLIEIILRKISFLNDQERATLSIASAIGRRFDLGLLFRVSELDHEAVVRIIDRAIALQLLEEDPLKKGSYLFFHDRIREAFYQGISAGDRKNLHLKTARVIEEAHPRDTGTVIFDLAYHYIEAADKAKVLEYAYPAGFKAKEKFANEEAIRYFNIVRYILEEQEQRGGPLWIDTMENLADIYLTIGENEKTIEIFNGLLKHVDSKNRKAAAYKQLSQAYFTKGKWNECEEFARMGLSLLGERLPVRRLPVLAGIVKELAVYFLRTRLRMSASVRRQRTGNEKHRIIIRFFMTLSWMYVLSDAVKFIRLVLRMVNLSTAKLGKSRELGMSMAVFASLLMVVPLSEKAIRHHRTALRMREEIADLYGTAQSLEFLGYCYTYMGDYYQSIDFFHRARAIFSGMGDIWEIAMLLNGLGYNHFFLGNYQEMIESFTQYLEISQKLNDYYGISVSQANLCLAWAQKGDFDEAEKWGRQALALSGEKELWYPHCFANINYGYLKMEMGNYDEAVRYLEAARTLYYKNNFLRDYTVYLFPYLAEAYLEVHKVTPSHISRRMVQKACRESLRKTKRWVNHYAAALRASAKYHALSGAHRKADDLFKQSIRHSARLGRRYELARSLYEYGLYLKQQGYTDFAETRFKTANQIFKEIEPTVYIKRTSDLLGISTDEDITSIRKLLDKQRMYSIIRVSQDISSILSLNELLEKVMSVAVEITGAQRGFLLIVHEETRELEIVAKKTITERDGIGDEYSPEIAEEVFRSGQAVLTANAMEDERFSKYPGVGRYGLKSILCIPIKYKDEIRGVCYLDNPLSVSVFSEDDQDVLNIIMTQVAISIEIVRLYEMAITDGLTKLITHRHFQNLLQKEMGRAARHKKDLSLIMLDIDRFKDVNDTYGHQAGDEVLSNISTLIKNSCRARDIVARYGGEELVIALPETPLHEAAHVAERIRRTVEHAETIYNSIKLRITVSMGISSFPYPAWDRESLVQAADRALYISKENGRNRVTAAGREVFDAGATKPFV